MQGNFHAHCNALERAGAQGQEVRTAKDLETVDGLVIPGGESTTILKLLDEENLFEPLKEFGGKKPIFGTCAGAILMASEVLNPAQRSLALMDLTVERNAYGRQLDSRIAQIDLDGRKTEAVFIRAPVIRRTGPKTKVLATYLHTPVLVQHGNHMVATFHPELSNSNLVHTRFVQGVVSPSEAEEHGS